MNMDEVKKQVAAAWGGNGVLRIEGYVDSKGVKRDYDVLMMGRGGYKELVALSKDALHLATLEGRTDDEDVLWVEEEARQALDTSFTSSLEGTHAARGGPALAYATDGMWTYEAGEKAGSLVLRDMCALAVSEGAESVPKRKSKPLVVAKRLLREQLPIDAYVGMLVLRPGKFDAVAALGGFVAGDVVDATKSARAALLLSDDKVNDRSTPKA